jgi:cytochrome c oxidase assembly factor 3
VRYNTDYQSDVEDLLPPLHARAGMRSIEDEERDLLPPSATRGIPQSGSPSALSPGIPAGPSTTTSTTGTGSEGWSLLPTRWRRLNEIGWIQRAGLVERGTGNVLVWGAPDVDNIGRLGDRADVRGRRGL